MEASPVFVGVDVSKARLDIASTGSQEAWSVANASDGSRSSSSISPRSGPRSW
jgi:hypothetical protein